MHRYQWTIVPFDVCKWEEFLMESSYRMVINRTNVLHIGGILPDTVHPHDVVLVLFLVLFDFCLQMLRHILRYCRGVVVLRHPSINLNNQSINIWSSISYWLKLPCWASEKCKVLPPRNRSRTHHPSDTAPNYWLFWTRTLYFRPPCWCFRRIASYLFAVDFGMLKTSTISLILSPLYCWLLILRTF